LAAGEPSFIHFSGKLAGQELGFDECVPSSEVPLSIVEAGITVGSPLHEEGDRRRAFAINALLEY
jgi:hypothetical protein